MTQIEGLWWPDQTKPSECGHALMHVKSLEWAIARCTSRNRLRTAVQAGGNVGLWPRRLAQSFAYVATFEPDDASRECLKLNVPTNVDLYPAAIGEGPGLCGIKHRGLGSHNVIDGDAKMMLSIDEPDTFFDVDFIQLDVEGYELHALRGAADTIARCKPLIQVELRDGPLERHGSSVAGVRQWLSDRGYRQVSAQQGSDFVFAPKGWAA